MSVGLGGDDDRYVLQDVVCKFCNSVTFSKLELVLMRESLIGLARWQSQRFGRDKAPVKYHADNTVLIDSVNGVLLEAVFASEGAFKVLPQAIFVGGDVIVYSAANSREFVSFLKVANSLVQKGEFFTVEKDKSGIKPKFVVSSYRLDGGRAELLDVTNHLQPPKEKGLWLEIVPDLVCENIPYHNRFYQRSRGNIVLIKKDSDEIGSILALLMSDIPKRLIEIEKASEEEVVGGKIHSRSMWNAECDRAIAKIGMNFVIHQMGERYARHKNFNRIKSAILTGEPSIPLSFIPDKMISEIMSFAPPDNHIVFVVTGKVGRKKPYAHVFFRFYGLGVNSVSLAGKVTPEDYDGTIYLINYKENFISRFSLREYVLNYNSGLMKVMVEHGYMG